LRNSFPIAYDEQRLKCCEYCRSLLPHKNTAPSFRQPLKQHTCIILAIFRSDQIRANSTLSNPWRHSGTGYFMQAGRRICGHKIQPEVLIFCVCNNKIAVHFFYCIFRNQYCHISIIFMLRIIRKHHEFQWIQKNTYHQRKLAPLLLVRYNVISSADFVIYVSVRLSMNNQ